MSFRRGQAAAHMRPTATAPGLDKYERDDHPDDYRHRMLVNLAAFVFVLLLIAAGYWLADTMARMRKDQDCVLSGRRGCSPINVEIPRNRWREGRRRSERRYTPRKPGFRAVCPLNARYH